jgi:hypothetical protein
LPAEQLFHDPIYGFIRVPDYLIPLIDTDEFQRLRNVRQLATVRYRYPGANHTRFEHLLGTYHISRLFLEMFIYGMDDKYKTNDKIEPPQLTNQMRMCVECAALLHDLGHGPFGHTMDFLLNRLGFDEKKRHEYFTCKWIKSKNTQINGILRTYNLNLDNICNLIMGDPPAFKYGPTKKGNKWYHLKENRSMYMFLANLTSSDLDADRIDYLVRDAYYTGVRMVGLDLTSLLSAAYLFGQIIPPLPPDTKTRAEVGLVFDIKLLRAIEAALLSWLAMYKMVYHQTTHRLLQEMVVKSFAVYVEEHYGKTNIKESHVERIMKWTDDEAIWNLRKYSSSKEIIDRVLHRKPYHIVLEETWSNLPSKTRDYILEYQGKFDQVPALEQELASKAGQGLKESDVVVSMPLIKPRTSALPLLEKKGNSYEIKKVMEVSDVAKAIMGIPFVDRLFIATSNPNTTNAVRNAAKDVFRIP